VLFGVQQQKGIVLAAAVALTWLAGVLIDRRFRTHRGEAVPGPSRAIEMVQISAGFFFVVAPLVAIFTIIAGPGPLYEMLVRFPLENSRGAYRSGGAALTPFTLPCARYTLRAFLAMLLWAPAVPAIDAVIGFARRDDEQRVRQRAILVAIAVFSVLSI